MMSIRIHRHDMQPEGIIMVIFHSRSVQSSQSVTNTRGVRVLSCSVM